MMAQTQGGRHQDFEDPVPSYEGSSLIMDEFTAKNDDDHAHRHARYDAQETRDEHPNSQLPAAAALKRYPLIVLFTICYIAVAAVSWGLLCVMTQRPIHGSTYGLDLNSTNYWFDSTTPSWIRPYREMFTTNERYLRAVRILQSGVSVLTIPLTSAVCSRAAVVFAQRRLSQGTTSHGHGPHITLRQTMALADRGWTDPSIIAKLLFGKWRQYGSRFLLLALVLNTIGVLISPLQELFVSYNSVKTPTYYQRVTGLMDFVNHYEDSVLAGDDGFISSLVRSRLASTQNTDVQMRLWSGGDAFGNNATSTAAAVAGGQFSLANMSTLHEPFWSQLPAGFSTGLITQYAPRINSTASWELLSARDFPSTCRQDPDALYIEYVDKTEVGYTAEICMPANMTQSPWRLQQSRQDFTEELYLTMNLTDGYAVNQPYFEPGVHTVRITMNTTAGYFELPNYRNNLTAGALLNDAPEQIKDPKYYMDQNFPNVPAEYSKRQEAFAKRLEEETAPKGSAANATGSLYSNFNKGPLNTIVLALFGQASFIDVAHTSLVTYDSNPWNETNGEFGCIMMVPFISLLQGTDDSWYSGTLRPCISRYADELTDLVKEYLYLFVNPPENLATLPDGEVIENALTAAAFIANEAWFLGEYYGLPTLMVNYDFGADTDVPHVSRAGMILITTLLGIDLACLLGLSLYSVAWMPRWTEQLDAFAMMRIGAATANDEPLWVAGDVDRIRSLDETPGWVGESIGDGQQFEDGPKDGTAAVGILRLGAKGPIRRRRKYRAYEKAQKSRKGWRRTLESRSCI